MTQMLALYPVSAPPKTAKQILSLPENLNALVFGAPGSGKTTIAIEVLAERHEARGYTPDEMLVLTHSRATATLLRDRVSLRLNAVSRGPLARSMQSVAFQIVQGFSEQPVALLTGSDQDQLLAELLRGRKHDGLRTLFGAESSTLRVFRDELRDLLTRCIEHGVSPEWLYTLGQRFNRREWQESALLFQEYFDLKDQVFPGYYDSAELSNFAAKVVRNLGHKADEIAVMGNLACLRLIVCDDAQELTLSNLKLLATFIEIGVSVIAFGDPDLASNGFRGGEASLFGSLPTAVQGTRLPSSGAPEIEFRRFNLPEVYRGRASIHQLNTAITAKLGAALGGRHRAASFVGIDIADKLIPVGRIASSSKSNEGRMIANILRERHLIDKIAWQSMAVVVRSGADIARLERILRRSGVPITRSGRAHLREATASRAFLLAAKAVLSPEKTNLDEFTELLGGVLGNLDPIGLRRLHLELRQLEISAGGDRCQSELFQEAIYCPEVLEKLDSRHGRIAAKFMSNLAAGRQIVEQGGSIEDLLWSIWVKSGLAKKWSTRFDSLEIDAMLESVVALFKAAARFTERNIGVDPTRFVDSILASEVAEDSLAYPSGVEQVHLGTPQTLVGRDFDVVIVAGLQEGIWPNLRLRSSHFEADYLVQVLLAERSGEYPPCRELLDRFSGVLQDELRLLALSVSRAKLQVVFSAVVNEGERPSRFLAFAPEALRISTHPMSLRSMVGYLRDVAVANSNSEKAAEAATALAYLAECQVPGAHPKEWYGTLGPSSSRPLIDLAIDPKARVNVSPSDIEIAEQSSLAWFINRMSAPGSAPSRMLGTLIHAVIEQVALSDDEPTLSSITQGLTEAWSKMAGLNTWEDNSARHKASKMVAGAVDYLREFSESGGTLLAAECSFSFEVEQVVVRGVIDRIERTREGTTVIVDLKTGSKMPTLNETIIHPQLASYQLAARAGSVPVTESLAGAKLVFLAQPTAVTSFSKRSQQVFDDESEQQFRDRIRKVGLAISGAEFQFPVELGYRSPLDNWKYTIHLVPAVSA